MRSADYEVALTLDALGRLGEMVRPPDRGPRARSGRDRGEAGGYATAEAPALAVSGSLRFSPVL